MNKLNQLVLFFSLVVSSFSNAQLEKGMYLIGGSANINSRQTINFPNKSFSLNFSPFVGIVLDKNWLLGSRLNMNYSGGWNSGEFKTVFFSIGAAPFVRKYFQSKKDERLYFYPQLEVGYWFRSLANSSIDYGRHFVSGNLGFGSAYFITPNISLDGVLGLNVNHLVNHINIYKPEINIGFNVGINVFLK